MHYRTAQLHKETVLVIRLHDSPRSATGRLLQLPRKSGMTSRNATSESGGEGPVRAGSAGSATPAEVRKVNNPVRAAFSARVCFGQNSHWRWDLFIGSEFGHFLPVVWPSIRCCDASLMWDCQPIKWIFFRPNQKFSHNKTKTKHNLPHEKKNSPRGVLDPPSSFARYSPTSFILPWKSCNSAADRYQNYSQNSWMQIQLAHWQRWRRICPLNEGMRVH